MEAEMEAQQYVGIDVAKESLAICVWGVIPTVFEIPNKSADIRRWLRTLAPDARLGMESTGSYHRLLADLAHQSGRSVYLLKPKTLKHYRHSVHARGKTDSIDARVLARYMAQESHLLRVWTPPTPEQERLDALLKVRKACGRMQGSIGQVADAHKDEIQDMLAPVQKALEKVMDTLERRTKQEIDKTPELADKRKRLETIAGVGCINSAVLTYILSRLDFRNPESVIAYLGLDPRPMESGKYRGRRRLSKQGPGWIRSLLHMAAMAAVKQPDWQSFLQRHVAKGLSRTAALCIVARKIVRIAWSIWTRPGEVYDARRIGAQLQVAT
jgi:transposase